MIVPRFGKNINSIVMKLRHFLFLRLSHAFLNIFFKYYFNILISKINFKKLKKIISFISKQQQIRRPIGFCVLKTL